MALPTTATGVHTVVQPTSSDIEASVASIAKRGIDLSGNRGLACDPKPVWTRLGAIGTELWLDTGDMGDAERLWSEEFTALTTNNTLLSKEVGKGIYDDLIRSAVSELRAIDGTVSGETLVQEIGILLNAHHGLRLVEKFDCRVSVELHTNLADDLEGSLAVGRRLHAICPSHFIVKVPLTPSGVLIARRLVEDGVPINFTLEFSARQNYVVARLANPNYVNVFLGRLNSFVADHGLGDGKMIGEKATLASQRELLALRASGGQTKQIAASMRSAAQVATLAGVDVFTMPIAVAEGMPALNLDPGAMTSQVELDPGISVNEDVAPQVLDALWTVDDELRASLDAVSRENLDGFSGDDLAGFLRERGHQDIFPNWSTQDLKAIADDGKIPSYPRWQKAFEAGEVGLDAALNAAGHASFAADQSALDDRIRSML